MKKEQKKTVIEKHQSHKKDTGSPQVQVAILTEKITSLTEHLKTHAKDKHSRRGLIGMVGKRRKLLRYLQLNDISQYTAVKKALGLRK
ncbi:30S ribosomal protein S15 [Candidatus Gracilibacteria bacterium]|nr:30S ribosomal protein S15 [Candidatus Gracilibacteria bacterium]